MKNRALWWLNPNIQLNEGPLVSKLDSQGENFYFLKKIPLFKLTNKKRAFWWLNLNPQVYKSPLVPNIARIDI